MDVFSLLFMISRKYIRIVISSLMTKFLAIALLLALAFPHHLSRGVVLCMAESGHVELEVAGSACCSSLQSEAAIAKVELQDFEDHCGSCNDLLLSCVAVRSRIAANAGLSDIDHTFGPFPWLGPMTDLFGRADRAQSDPTRTHAVEANLAPRTFPTVIRC